MPFPKTNVRKSVDGKWELVNTNENISVPSSSPYIVKLNEIPDDGTEKERPKISGLLETSSYPPSSGRFYVNYKTGTIAFNAAQKGQNFTVNYWKRGSLIDAEDINEIYNLIQTFIDTTSFNDTQIAVYQPNAFSKILSSSDDTVHKALRTIDAHTHFLNLTLGGDLSGSWLLTSDTTRVLSVTVIDDSHNHSNSTLNSLNWSKLLNVPSPTITLTGAVIGSNVMSNLGNVVIDTTASHSNLINLSSDDHLQYALLEGRLNQTLKLRILQSYGSVMEIKNLNGITLISFEEADINFRNLVAGETNSILIEDSGTIKKRTINSNVWSSSLVVGDGTPNYVTYWSGGSTLTSEQYLSVSRGGTGAGSFSQNYLLKGNNTSAINVSNIYNDSSGNLGLGTFTFGSSAANVFGIVGGTAPTTSPENTVQMWASDRGGVDGKAGLHILAEDGSLTVISDRILLVGTPSTTIDTKILAEGTENVIFKISSINNTTSSYSGYELRADTNNVQMFSHAPARTVSRFGITLGGWFEINAGGVGNNGIIIGTTQSQPIVFGTNNIERMRILESGNIGIGTSSPGGYKLYVNGPIGVAGNVVPGVDANYDLGTSSLRFNNIYSQRLNVVLTANNVSSNQPLYLSANVNYSASGTYYNRSLYILSYVNPDDHQTANNAGHDRGMYIIHYLRKNAGTINEITGARIEAGAYGPGGADVSATITNFYVLALAGLKRASTTITNAYGISIAGNIVGNNAYGIHITGVSGTTSAYGIYQNDANIKNYFASSIMIGANDIIGTSGTKILALSNGTAPTSSPTDAVQLWSADRGGTNGKASLHIRTEDGTSHVFGDRVGIGTTAPSDILDVNGNAIFAGSITPKNDVSYDLGTSSYKWNNIYARNLVTTRTHVNTTGASINTTHNTNYSSSGTYYNRALLVTSYINPDGDQTANNSGYDRAVQITQFLRENAGTLTDLTGIYVEYGSYGPAGADVSATITNAYGLRLYGVKVSSTTITNNYGIYLSGISGTNAYGIYQNDASIKNYFASSIMIGANDIIGTSGTKILALSNGNAPTSSPTDAFQMYSADQVAGNACPHFRTENGSIIKLFKASAITTALTTITCSDPTTPDYTITDPVQNTGYGFSTEDEFKTIMSVIANLQARVNALENVLQENGLLT